MSTRPDRPAARAARLTEPALLEAPSAVVAEELGALDWSFEDAPGPRDAHGLHPYPARFVAQLPRQVIRVLSEPGDLVLDPFSGGGTTAVEALALERRFHGIDANPVGNAIGRAKTQPLPEAALQALRRLEARLLGLQPDDLAQPSPWLPSIPNQDKWYGPEIFAALGVVRALVVAVDAEEARALALLAFAQSAAKLSYQESETRYTSKPREIPVLQVPRTVVAELRRMRGVVEALGPHRAAAPGVFVDADARSPEAYPAPSTVDLVVTSPPYPNTYDYHLYHRFRLFWLGAQPAALRRVEIGSHLKNQGVKQPIEAYLEDLRTVFVHCARALRAGGFAVFVVGDGLFKGEVFHTAGELATVAVQAGFEHVTTIDRPLPQLRRSVTKPGRRLVQEQLLVLRKPADLGRLVPPNYRLFPYERVLQEREVEALAPGKLERAAFLHGVERDGQVRPTLQSQVEAASATSRKKNSTYFAHGIHRYKGKFYPQLAKALFNLSGLEPGQSLVLDPFGGSGTVALEAVLNGYDAVSIDCNPVAASTARAKIALAQASLPELQRELTSVRAAVREAQLPLPGGPYPQFAADTADELARWFPPAVLAKLDWLLTFIRRRPRPESVAVLEVLVSDLIREVSQQEPKDLRIRRRAQPIVDADVFGLFVDRLELLQTRIETFRRHAAAALPRRGTATLLQGDSADPETFAALGGRSLDAVVSSPPYAAALPYVDTDRLSLAAVFGYSSRSRRPLERTLIGSREIGERERAAYDAGLTDGTEALPASTNRFLLALREAVGADADAGFRKQQAPAVLARYFCGMSAVLENVAKHLKPGGSCWLVLGDSRTTISGVTWTIPTVDEVASIGQHRGLELVERIPITVTREDVLHSRNTITKNEIVRLRAHAQP